ncbi:MAG TPA: glycosyltransferase 87 family protein [Polyangia bacterium]
MRRAPALVAVLVAAAAGAWFVARSYQQDFAAYWMAAWARLAGLDPYVNYAGQGHDIPLPWDGVAQFRHSRFLYPPLVVELFRPLLGLPYLAAKALFTGAMLAAWIGAGLTVTRDRRERAVFFGLSALFFPFYRHLERGQIDLLILLLLALAWRARESAWLAGAALAATAALKPAFAGMLPVVWALGRARAALAALAVGGALVGVTALVDGPAALREYVTEVVPRASLYGEGGTEEMLLPSAPVSVGRDDGMIDLDGRTYRLAIGDAPASASIPRLLAPGTPTPTSARLPFALAIAGLTLLARLLRSGGDTPAETLLYWTVAVACVITSPAGWVMGLVLALPLATHGVALAVRGRLPRGPVFIGAIAWIALAVPQPFSGWAAAAASALLGAAVATATALRRGDVPA